MIIAFIDNRLFKQLSNSRVGYDIFRMSHDCRKQCGLAVSVRSHQGVNLVLAHCQINSIEDLFIFNFYAKILNYKFFHLITFTPQWIIPSFSRFVLEYDYVRKIAFCYNNVRGKNHDGQRKKILYSV